MKTYYVWQCIASAAKGYDIRRPVIINTSLVKTELDALELIYAFGQNEMRPSKTHASVAMGDIIEYENKLYIILSVGFGQIDAAELERYKKLDAVQKIFYAMNPPKIIKMI